MKSNRPCVMYPKYLLMETFIGEVLLYVLACRAHRIFKDMQTVCRSDPYLHHLDILMRFGGMVTI